MKAIILAAGFSTRLYPLTKNIPKCLLPINNEENILDRQIRILRSSGIKEIIVVVGFEKERIAKFYKNKVIIFPIPHYGVGSAYSLWSAREILNGDMLILNSDVIFAKKTIKDIEKKRGIYCLVVEKKICRREDQKVRVKNRQIIQIGKYISLKEAYGEFVGIAKISEKGAKVFKKALRQAVRDNPPFYFPEVFNYLIKEGSKVHFIKAKTPWIDVDTKEDYLRAKEILRYMD